MLFYVTYYIRIGYKYFILVFQLHQDPNRKENETEQKLKVKYFTSLHSLLM